MQYIDLELLSKPKRVHINLKLLIKLFLIKRIHINLKLFKYSHLFYRETTRHLNNQSRSISHANGSETDTRCISGISFQKRRRKVLHLPLVTIT